MRTRGPNDRPEVPPGLVAYEITDEHTLFVLDLPRVPDDLPLTGAEREVVGLVLRGESNAAIAALRGVSMPTVAKQVSSAFVKLGVRSRAEFLAALITSTGAPGASAGGDEVRDGRDGRDREHEADHQEGGVRRSARGRRDR